MCPECQQTEYMPRKSVEGPEKNPGEAGCARCDRWSERAPCHIPSHSQQRLKRKIPVFATVRKNKFLPPPHSVHRGGGSPSHQSLSSLRTTATQVFHLPARNNNNNAALLSSGVVGPGKKPQYQNYNHNKGGEELRAAGGKVPSGRWSSALTSHNVFIMWKINST